MAVGAVTFPLVTVTADVAFTEVSVEAIAVIVAVPTFFAVTTPELETVATLVSELDQVTVPWFAEFVVFTDMVVVFSFSTDAVVGVTANLTNFTVTAVAAWDKFPAASIAFT